MASASGDDVLGQLATLLGKGTVRLRTTDTTPPLASVIDVISLMSGKNQDAAAQDLRRMIDRYPDVSAGCTYVKFPDARGRKGQKESPVAGARNIVEIVMLLQGHRAATIRRQAAELLCRGLSAAIWDWTHSSFDRAWQALICI